MSEIEQIKKRINDSGPDGVQTARIRDDFQPAGDLIMLQLLDSGEFVSRKVPKYMDYSMEWRIFSANMAPY